MSRDFFDRLLNCRISLWKKGGTGTVDSHGFESQEYVLMVADVPAVVMPGPGKELATDAAFGIQKFTFHIRPLQVDDPPRDINIHDWVQVNMKNGQVLIDPPSPDGPFHDIKNVKNPKLLDHHLELSAEFIEP